MISHIYLNEKANTQFKIKNTPRYLFEINHINVFVGINNSGKSRLIRTLFSNESQVQYFKKLSDDSHFKEIKKYFLELYEAAERLRKHHRYILKDAYNFTSEIYNINITNYKKLFEIAAILNKIDDGFFRDSSVISSSRSFKEVISKYKQLLQSLHNYTNNLIINPINKLYIPTLRGLRPIQVNSNGNSFNNDDSYSLRTRSDYFSSLTSNCTVFSGLSIYKDVMRLLLGDESQRKLIRDFEDFIGSQIFKKKVTLIPKYQEDVLHIKIEGQPQFPIYNLGDGLQTLISILFPIFTRRDSDYAVFIEEPETHLHSKWQSLLVEALKQFENHIFFISTHSASFINSSNTSTFIIKKSGEFSEILHANLDEEKRSIINDLGYKPSDLLQTNYVLWVEGPSDKNYFNYWLSIKAPELREQIHYSIMFYGGSSYKSFTTNDNKFNLNTIKSINQNFGIILDSDRKSSDDDFPKGKEDLKDFFEKNDHFCWLTSYREIENYIPFEDFLKAVKKHHKKENIKIGESVFDDRNTVEDLDSEPSFKSRIKLSEDIFKTIQKNNDGTTKGINAKLLRKSIEESIKQSKKSTFSIDKVKVSKEIIALKPEIKDSELNENLGRLIDKIKAANNI